MLLCAQMCFGAKSRQQSSNELVKLDIFKNNNVIMIDLLITVSWQKAENTSLLTAVFIKVWSVNGWSLSLIPK